MTDKVTKEVKRRDTDWEAVHRDFRTGKFTVRELGTKYNISHQAVARRSKLHDWQKDLLPEIREATNALLVKNIVNKEVAKAGQEVANTVLAAAEINTQVILKHRKDIEATRLVASQLLAEVANSSLLVEEQEVLAAILAGGNSSEPTDTKKLADARRVIQKALDIGNRVGSVKLLADTFTKLQGAERKAFGLTDVDDGDDTPKVTIKDLTGRKD